MTSDTGTTKEVTSGVTSLNRFLSGTFRTGMIWFHLPGVIAWIAVSLGIALSGIPALSALTTAASPATLGVLALLLLVPGVLTRMIAIRFISFFFCAILITSAAQSHQRTVYRTLHGLCMDAQPISLSGTIVSPPMPWFENFHFLLKIDSLSGDPGRTLKGITLNCTLPFEPSQYGTITVTGRFSPPRVRKNPHAYDEYNAMMAKGVWGYLEAESGESATNRLSLLEKHSIAFRGNADAAIRKISDYDLRALLHACFLGDKEYLSPSLKEHFRVAGIYHLIAISGLHTAILTGALYFLLRLLPLGRLAPHLICIAALWLYLLFIGMIPSLFRATVMTTLVIVSLLFERKNYPMQTIGLAGTVWLLLSPESLASPGYQLSFAATTALLTLFPALFRYCPRVRSRFAAPVVVFLFSSLSISLISFLATAPILLYHFGTVSFFGIIANLIAVSAMTAGMWGFFAGLLFEMTLPFIAGIPLWTAERFLDIVVGTGHLAMRFPWSQAAFPVPYTEMIVAFSLLLIGIAAVRSERVGRYLLISLAAAMVFIPADLTFRRLTGTVQAVRFDLPRSALAGIKWPDNTLWLASPSLARCSPRDIEREVLPWLRHQGSGRASVLLVPEEDDGAAATLMAQVKALSSAVILTIPRQSPSSIFKGYEEKESSRTDSVIASWTPCRKCTCSVISGGGFRGIRIAAAGADTALIFPVVASRKGKKRKSVPATPRTPSGAVILNFNNGRVFAFPMVPVTHPLRRAEAEDYYCFP
ncbi:MAG: ComEC/Rec2 family competence protein [Chitinispirillaceae bacterium]|nr:ComEC/Rec2 family competence protein [Chitinispirillaceae bacterium]